MRRQLTKTFSLLIVICGLSVAVNAQKVTVAVAANLQPVIKALQKDFKSRTGVIIDVISGASGNLSTQIRNGAPYDVFMSADKEFPQSLYQDRIALEPPVVYAEGVLIICSIQNLNFTNWEKLLQAN